MNGRKKLAGQRIAVLATDGFEQVELSVPVTALKAAGAQVEIASRAGAGIGRQGAASRRGVGWAAAPMLPLVSH